MLQFLKKAITPKPSAKKVNEIVVLIIALVICFSSCNTGKEYIFKPEDTTETFILFVTPVDWASKFITSDQVVQAKAKRVTKDALMFDSVNALTRKWQRDTVYIIQFSIPKIDSATRKIVLDSAKNPVMLPGTGILEKRFILQDFNKNPNAQK